MHTNDVCHRLLEAPLAVYDEDIQEDKNISKRIRKVLIMNRSKKNHHGNENNDTDSKNDHQRFPRRRKSSSVVVPNPTLELLEMHSNARIVRIRLVFIHIGDIDTLNEKYQADIYYEARWIEKRVDLNTLNLTSQQRTQLLHENNTLKMNKLHPIIPWSPRLFIENAAGQIGGQEEWFTLKKSICKPISSVLVNLDICEHHRMKGVFWEKLELNHFPADVQDLTISIASGHHIEHCRLVQDEQIRSSINREAFSDQQEWSLYEHVATEMRQTQEEYSFDDEYNGIQQKKHPVLSVTCRAARQPGYYYWNGFCLIFLITICSFCIFSIPPDLPQSRLQITCTLLLTSVTFRWVVNRSLPQISYLTTLDVYGILSIIILVALCIWHSIIATIIFFNQITTKLIEPTNSYVLIDRYVFIGMFILYIIIHISLIIWLICVPYKRRREMEYLDRQYEAKKYIQLDTSQSRYGSKQDITFRRLSSTMSSLPIIQTVQSTKHSDGIMIIPSASSFLPIHEDTNETTIKVMNMIELRQQDEQF